MTMKYPPNATLALELVAVLRNEAPTAESTGTLTPHQLAHVYREGWFRMFVPAELNGMQLDLPEGLRLEEDLAWVDGSLGWTVTLCSGATMFAGFLDPELMKTLFQDPAVCFGGSGQASGTAIARDGGYLVNGSWRYATGAPHLSVFTANCFIEQDGKRLIQENGEPLIRSFYFERPEVSIHDDWHTMGLKATAGHQFEVKDLWVPAGRSFDIQPASATFPGLLFQYPFLPFAEATLAVNTSGMSLHFLDLCTDIFEKRTSSKRYSDETIRLLKTSLEHAKNEMSALRKSFYAAVGRSWHSLTKTGSVPKDELDEVSRSSRLMARRSRELVQELFPYCGMAAVDPDSEINRVWRDLFTASQHSLLAGIR